MIKFIKNLFSPKNREDKSQNVKNKSNGKRLLELDKGDACLILKENGTSIIIDSGDKQLSKADEIICMVWCYLANPEFVHILETMFSDIVDSINSDKMRDNMSIGRSGVYAKGEKDEKQK